LSSLLSGVPAPKPLDSAVPQPSITQPSGIDDLLGGLTPGLGSLIPSLPLPTLEILDIADALSKLLPSFAISTPSGTVGPEPTNAPDNIIRGVLSDLLGTSLLKNLPIQVASGVEDRIRWCYVVWFTRA
jgi:hypothetical protein